MSHVKQPTPPGDATTIERSAVPKIFSIPKYTGFASEFCYQDFNSSLRFVHIKRLEIKTKINFFIRR